MKAEAKLEVIRGLLKYEGRVEEIKSNDILLIVCLLIHGGDEQPVRMSNSTVSMELGCTEPTLSASVNRLVSAGWLTFTSGKSRKQPSVYTVLIDALPVADELKRTIISPAMTTLAVQYTMATKVSLTGKKRKFTKAHLQRYAFTLQTLLEKHCAGDEVLLRGAVNFALSHPTYRVKANRGPHDLRRVFRKMLAEFKDAGQPAPAPAKPTAPAQRVDPDLHPWDVAPLPSRVGLPVYKIQNLAIAGADAFRDALNDAASTVKENENCALFIVQPDGTRTEQRVSVTLFGSMRSVLDVKTGKDALPPATAKAA
ncbi:MAG TPA: hypothetical protein VFF95_18570 [Candidatus Binatus sp.]|jgi:hypothetical protein|nr:hypothetical protein [Candidatus Binatus sp.]